MIKKDTSFISVINSKNKQKRHEHNRKVNDWHEKGQKTQAMSSFISLNELWDSNV